MDNETLYAQIENGIVQNIISWDGNTDVSSGGWQPPEDATMVQLADGQAASIGYPAILGADGSWTFEAPPQPSPPVITPGEILTANTQHRDELLSRATLAIAPLQDAVDLEVATAEETALLKQWKQFRIAVNRIDCSVASPPWPSPPVPFNYAQAPADQTS